MAGLKRQRTSGKGAVKSSEMFLAVKSREVCLTVETELRMEGKRLTQIVQPKAGDSLLAPAEDSVSPKTVANILSDPFEHLKCPPAARYIVPVHVEKVLERVGKELRDEYSSWVKRRYRRWDLDRVVGALKESIVQQAIVQTSRGPLERDPVCLFSRPIYDEATCVAYAYADQMINLWREKVAVIDLGLEHANRRDLETVLEALRPLFYNHCGHGMEDALLGQNGEKILDAGNIHVLNGCMVHTTACHSNSLAEVAIEHGCVGWSGYQEFKAFTDIAVARLRFRILSGVERPLKAEDLNSAEEFVSEALKSALIHDRDDCFLLGDPEARIAAFGRIDRQRYRSICSEHRS